MMRIGLANIRTKTRSRRCWVSPTQTVKEKSWTKKKGMPSKERIEPEVSSKKIILIAFLPSITAPFVMK